MIPARRFLYFALALAVAPAALAVPSAATAQVDDERPPGTGGGDDVAEDEGPPPVVMPWRILASIGGGATLRIVNDLTLEQKRFAPSFIDIAGSVVFPGAGRWRHGATLAISTNLNGEGPGAPDPNGIDPASQWTLTPSYLAYFRFGEDLVLTGRAGVNLTASPYFVLGGELSLGAVFLFTAGLGAYVELSGNLAFGLAPEPLPTVSAELGIMIDFEVLP